jgi:hypothetical protein
MGRARETKSLPDADHLKSRIDYDPETGEMLWKPRAGIANSKSWNTRFAGKPAGTVATRGDGYQFRQIKIEGRMLLAARVAWKIMRGTDPRGRLYHVNGDPLDNRYLNLREADE